MGYIIPFVGFVVTTFAYAFCWHLVVFKKVYDDIGIYNREQPIIPIGVFTVFIQGAIFLFLYSRVSFGVSALWQGAVLGLLLGLFEYCSGSLAFSAKRKIEKHAKWLIIQLCLSASLFPISGAVAGYLCGIA